MLAYIIKEKAILITKRCDSSAHAHAVAERSLYGRWVENWYIQVECGVGHYKRIACERCMHLQDPFVVYRGST